MTREEIIYRCLIYIDYFDEKCEGVLANLKHTMKECGFRYNDSRVLNDKIIIALFPTLGKFDLRLPDLRYKRSVLKAIYFFCKGNIAMRGELGKNLEEYDHLLVDPEENDPFW